MFIINIKYILLIYINNYKYKHIKKYYLFNFYTELYGYYILLLYHKLIFINKNHVTYMT